MNGLIKKVQRMWRSGFGRDIIFTAGGQVAVLALALVVNKLMSTYLEPSDYTIFSIANKGAGVLGFIMLFGLGIAIPRYVARIKANKNKIDEASFLFASACIFTIASSLLIVLVTIFKTQFATLVFNDVDHEYLVMPMVIFAFSIAVSTFLYSYFRGVDKFKEYSISQVVLSIMGLVVVIICGANIADQLLLRGFLTIAAVVAAIGFIVWFTYRFIRLKAKIIRGYLKQILVYCFPRVPGEFILFAYTVLPLIIINTRFGSEPAAAFAVAITLNLAIAPAFQLVGTVLLPYVSKKLAQGDTKDISRKVGVLRKIYLSVGILSAVAVFAFTDIIISLLFTKDYIVYAETIRIMYLSVVPYALYLLLRNPIDAASTVPFNTINLAVSFSLLIAGVSLGQDLHVVAIAFPASYVILAILSEFTWKKQLSTELGRNKRASDT